jgi:hypothetical protein
VLKTPNVKGQRAWEYSHQQSTADPKGLSYLPKKPLRWAGNITRPSLLQRLATPKSSQPEASISENVNTKRHMEENPNQTPTTSNPWNLGASTAP